MEAATNSATIGSFHNMKLSSIAGSMLIHYAVGARGEKSAPTVRHQIRSLRKEMRRVEEFVYGVLVSNTKKGEKPKVQN